VKSTLTNKPDQAEPEDAALFLAAVGAVKPLPDQNRIDPQGDYCSTLFFD